MNNFTAKLELYFRVVLLVISTLYYTFTSSFIMIFFRSPRLYYNQARKWSRSLIRIAKIDLDITGKIDTSEGQTYIFISNHTSLFDIPILVHALQVNLRIIYKKELEKIPLFGWGLALSPYISIVRDDPRNSMQSIDQAASFIRNGDSVVIYPEGTRSKDGKIQPFKRGAFLLASRAGKPIIPITIIGASQIMSPGSFRLSSGKVRVIIHEKVENNAQNKKDEVALMTKVFSIVAEPLLGEESKNNFED